MTITSEICDVTVHIQAGWLSAVSGTPVKESIHLTVIPAIDEDHAHEIWKTVCDGFTHVDSWKTLERAPGHRMYVQRGNIRRYLTVSICINH